MAAGVAVKAEDSDRLRPYIYLRSAEFNTVWDVLDGYSIGAGVNLNRYWGVELAADFYEMYLEDPIIGKVGEEAVWNFIPQVRFRYPILNDRLVPYLIAGVGPASLQFNDRSVGGFGQDIDADGYSWSASVGGGIEYFLTDSVAFNLEGKYLWTQPIDISINGNVQELDMSAPMVTFGFRVFLDDNHVRPMPWAAEDIPVRLFFGAHFGVGAMTDGDWASGVSLEPEVSRWGSLNQIYGISVGADFGRHWGVELTIDSTEWGVIVDGVGQVCEYAFVPVIPQVRYRHPLGDSRWVPFVMGGVGGAYGERNDVKPAGATTDIDAKGVYPVASAGAGIEYFFSRSASISGEVHWNYTWGQEISVNNGPTMKGDFANWQAQVALRLYLLEF
jgi:opacity protein-like surface antigen